MAITSSAKKAIRVAERKRVFNLRRSKAMNDLEKQIKKAVTAKKVKDAEALVPKYYKAVDKAVKMDFIKKNNGSRKKSRIVHLIRKISK